MNRYSVKLNSNHSVGQIQVIIVNEKNHIINQKNFIHNIGSKFNPRCVLDMIPDYYRFVKVITGEYVKLYQTDSQRIVIEVTRLPYHQRQPQESQNDEKISAETAKEFIEYYNHQLLGAQSRPLKPGQLIAHQCIQGINDARQGATPQSDDHFYRMGYQTYKQVKRDQHLKYHLVTLRQALLLTFNLIAKSLKVDRFYK